MNNRKKIIIGYACAFGAVIFWGFHGVVIRSLIKEGVDPFLIGVLRLFIGAAVLALISSLIRLKQKTPVVPLNYSKFFWLIAVSLALNFLLFHKGLEFTIASDAILLEAFSPVMVLVIIMLFLPSKMNYLLKQPNLPQKILQTIIIGSIGSSFLLLNDPGDLLSSSHSKIVGDVIEFFAMFAWTLVLLGMHEYQQREKPHDTIAATAQFLFFAGLIISPFAKWSGINALTQNEWFWILILGVFSTSGAYALWHFASKYLDIFPLITIFNFTSIFTVINESLVLGLRITWKLIVGGILILYSAMQAKIIDSKYKILEKEEMTAE